MSRELLSRRTLIRTSLAAVAGVSAGFGATWQKTDPSQWSTEEVYQILNDSPWSKTVQVAVMPSAMDQERGGRGGWDEGVPGGMGGGGWGGMGGPGTGGPGMGRRRGGYPANGPTVTIRWVSALPVRLAEAKSSGSAAGETALKPMDQYVIAVLGMPKSGFTPRSESRDSDDAPDDKEFAGHLKTITSLIYSHQRVGPERIELNQGRDARTLFYFDKSDPIELKDKEVEFRVNGDRMQIRRKFILKDMQYDGKLEL